MPEQKMDESQNVNASSLGQLQLLLAEDNQINQLLIRKLVADWGFKIDIAQNGLEALELFNQFDYDLILMDMALPSMDELAATRRIKDIMEGSDIPIIGITAHGNFYNKKALEAGCVAIVSKPIDLKKLSRVIAKYLKP